MSPKGDTGDLSKVEKAAQSAGSAVDKVSGKKVSVSADSGSLDKVQSAAQSASGAVDSLNGKKATVSADTGQLDQVAGKARTAAESVEQVTAAGAGMPGMFSSAAGAAAGLAGALVGITSAADAFGKIVSIGMEFQSQMNTMSAVSGATGAQLEAVGAKARELGTDASLTATSASDAAAAMTELAKGGFTVEQSMAAAKGTLQLAAAAQVSAADAATIQSQALQAFALGAEDASRVSDILAGAANASSAEMTGISQGLQQAGTVANQFGVSVDDTATALAMFANAGIQGSDAGTLMKSALLALTDQGKPAQAAIDQLGLTVYDANGKFVGMSNLMGQLKTASMDMTAEQYQAATATLFGSDAMRLAGIAAQQGSEGFDSLKEAVTRQGQAAEVAAAQTQGLPGVWERLQNTMEDIQLGAFDAMQESLVEAGNSAVDLLDSAAPAIESFAGAVGTGIGGAVDALNLMVDTWDKIPGPMQDVIKLFGVFKAAQKLWGTDMIQNLKPAEKFKASISGIKDGLGFLRAEYQRGSAPLKAMSANYRELSAAAKLHSTTAADAFTSIDHMGQAMGRSVQSSVMSMAGTMRGVGVAGFSALKNGASGVVNFLGGPWMVALEVAGAAVMGIMKASRTAAAVQENYAAAADEAAEAQTRLNASLAGSKDALNTDQIKDAGTMVKAQLSDMTTFGEELNSVFNVMSAPDLSFWQQGHWNAEWREYTAQAEEMKQGYDQLKDTANELGYPLEKVNEIVAAGGKDYDNLIASLRGSGDAGNFAADQLEAARGKIEESIEAARQLDPAAAQAAAGIDVLADSSASADEKLSALKSTMQAMGLLASSAKDAEIAAAKQIDQVTEEVTNGGFANTDAGIGSAMFDDSGELDVTNANAQKLHETLQGLYESLGNVAIANGDVDATWKDMQPTLEATREAMGLAGSEFDEQWSHLVETYGLVPEVIHTLVELDGASEAVQSLGDVWAALYQVDQGAKVNIDPPAPEVLATMDALHIKYEAVRDDAGNVIQYKVTAPSDEVKAQLESITTKMAEIDDQSVTIEAVMDTTPIEMGAAEADALLRELDIQDPSPTAQLVIDDLENNHQIALGDLEYLNQQSANPVADLDKLLLDAGVADAHAQLQGVDDHNTSSDIKAENSDLITKVSDALTALSKIPLTKTVSIVAKRIGNWFTGGSGSHTGEFYAGGEIPALAAGGNTTGYRLPTTGPGTNMIDGFLGVTGSGMPIARVNAGEWVVNGESSDQYNRTLAAINANNPRAIMASLARELPAYADGGRAKSEEVIAQLSAFDGGPYVMGGFSPSAFDCSGAVAATVNTWMGLDPFDSRMSTVNEGAWLAAKGFENGRGNGNELVVGWYDYGGGANGHTALMLPDGTFIESGGNTGQGFTIGGPAGPLDGRGFTNFMYLPGSGDESSGGELTGDLGEIEGYGTTFDDVSLSGIGSSYSGGKNTAGAYAKAARSARVARATSGIGRNPGGASADAYGSASAWNSIMKGDFSPEAIRLASNGQGFAGLGMSAQDIIGPEVSAAVQDALKQAGFKGDVSGALGQELMINVGMSEETLTAFKSLEEARDAKQAAAEDVAKAEQHLEEVRKKSGDTTDQLSEKILEQEKEVAKAKEKAAQPIKKGSSTTQADLNDKVAKEEKKLADLREQATEKQNASTEEMADAERGLAIARQALAAAGSAEAAAMTDLRIAAVMAAVKIVDKIMAGITGAITGAFQGVADRADRLSGVMSLLSENIDLVTQAAEKQMAAQQTALAAQIDAQKALDDAHETERQAKYQQQQDIRAVQQAEFDLAMARSDAAEVVGYRETVLSEVRERGILQVAATSNAADRAAIQAASNVATAEAALAQARAALDKNNFDRTVNVAESNKALDRAQEKARYEMDRLTRASLDLARSQNLAAGEIGGAGALEEYIKGLQDNATAVADMAAADAKSAQLSNLWIGNWGKFGEAANERMAAESKQTEAQAKIRAWESEAMKELSELEKSNPEEAQRMRALIDAVKNPGRYELGDVSTGIADFFSGSDGALTRAKKMGTTQAAFLEMQRILAESNERIKQGQYTSDKESKSLDDEYKAKEIDWQIQDLNDLIGRQDEKDILSDTLATLQNIYDEHQQENKQLGGIDSKLDKRQQSVLMSIGGSTWGNGANDRIGLPTGTLTGFGGLTRGQVSAYDSLNVENGWRGTDILRPITEYISDTAADAAAAAGRAIEGLPETVAEGRYARLMNAPVAGAVESAQSGVLRQQQAQSRAAENMSSMVAQLLNPAGRGKGTTTTVGTQFTGAVTINSAKADSLVDALGNQLLKG
ncbi:phage tail tape measure protein [Corynebacterium phoceense]|uniref:phage tail tape measure protein n=1 Tax=Corynebacterium phoceense TaxID=1686286 RepID=UPI0018AA0EF9|nr:phage tail tape measure protein [Corynebacterium phoceense]MBF9011283.1 phage tail tape measure protein [Corynebacterium phoceense]